MHKLKLKFNPLRAQGEEKTSRPSHQRRCPKRQTVPARSLLVNSHPQRPTDQIRSSCGTTKPTIHRSASGYATGTCKHPAD